MGHQAFFFSICEFYFLLLQSSSQGLTLFEEIKNYMPTDSDIAEGVISLTEKGILTAVDGHYRLAQEIKDALKILSGAKASYIVHGHLSGCPVQCLYFDKDQVLSLEMDEVRKSVVRLEVMDKCTAVSGLMEYEFMPEESLMEPDEDTWGFMLGVFENSFWNMEVEELLGNESVLLVIDRFLRGSETHSWRAAVVYRETNVFLCTFSDDDRKTELYSYKRDNFMKLFMEE